MDAPAIPRAVVLIAFLFSGIFLPSCHKESEDDRVRKVIASIEKAAQGKDIRGILFHLSKTYHDPQGNDYESIKGLLLFYFSRHQAVSIFIPDVELSVGGSAATAKFQAVLSGRNRSAGDMLPEALGVYNFDVSFARESNDWKVTSAKWERFAGNPSGSP
jgi:hypothetical protein